MEYNEAMRYFDAITVIEAQNMLISMQVADYPNMKRDDRSRLHREIHKKAYPFKNVRKMSGKEASEHLRMMLNGRR